MVFFALDLAVVFFFAGDLAGVLAAACLFFKILLDLDIYDLLQIRFNGVSVNTNN
mgnify:CR=1 FL=1